MTVSTIAIYETTKTDGNREYRVKRVTEIDRVVIAAAAQKGDDAMRAALEALFTGLPPIDSHDDARNVANLFSEPYPDCTIVNFSLKTAFFLGAIGNGSTALQ